MAKVHNKLVRDKIPTIVAGTGHTATTRILDDAEYVQALIAKLSEECAEFTEAVSLEELADIQEVVFALADAIASRTELEQTRVAKAEERGAFAHKTFLESVD